MFFTFSQPNNPAMKPIIRNGENIQETLRSLLKNDDSADLALLNLDMRGTIMLKVNDTLIKVARHETLSGRN